VELTKKEIDSIRKKIAKQNSVFSDKKYLDSLFLPSNIIGRRKQAEQLLKHIESLKQGFVVPQISVYGRSGSGKSTVVKFVCQNIQDVVSFAFVNLRKSKTVFGSANLILSELGSSNLKSAEGLNKAVDKIGERIEAILISENKKFFLLVLDEYDVIFSDPRGKPSDFVYKLLTLEENLREKGLWLCIITISNNALSDYELDDRVKSRMGNSEVFFEPYSEDDVMQILLDRADKAFLKKVDNEMLQYCAELSSCDHGDARRAVDLLRVAGELSDGKKITKSDVDKAQEQLQKDRMSTIVSSASYHLRIVIGAICANTLLTGNSWNATSAIYAKYSKMMAKDTKPLSYRRIVDLLVELENTGLVTSRTLSRGRHGYGTEYKLKLSPDMVGPVIGKEWWENLIKMKENKEKMKELEKDIKELSSSRGQRRFSYPYALFKKYGL
jgi:cell division control protein 6